MEAAGVQVEGLQVGLEVDVEPGAAGGTGFVGSGSDQGPTYALAAVGGVDGGVENEGVGAAVPGDLDEADQLVVVEGADPGEGVAIQAGSPRLNGDLLPAEGQRVQSGQFKVVHGEADS